MSLYRICLGNGALYRIGRKIYMAARGEVVNDMSSNGELLLQRCVIDAWRRSEPPGNLTVIDVGANTGAWTAALLDSLTEQEVDRVSVTCFEPAPAAADHLRNRFNRHRLGRAVRVEQMAASAVTEEIPFFVIEPSAGTNSVYDISSTSNREVIKVQAETLDRYCRTHGTQVIDLVKCDTEGHDMDVIRGARTLLHEGRISVMQFEYNYRWIFGRNYLRDVFLEIAGLPYRVGKVLPDKVLLFSDWHYELDRFFEGNYVLLHERALPSISTRLARWDKSNALTF